MGVEQVAREHDMAVVLSEMQGRRTPGRSWIEGVLARRPTGVIAVLSDLNEDQRALLNSRGISLVVVDPTGEPLHDTPSIGATNWSGGLAATRHLLGLGHRRIGVIAGPESVLCSRARLDGYRAAMDEAEVPVDPDLIRYGNFHVQDGVAEGRTLLRLPDRPTAIFAGNDLQALGVYQAAREARLHIPEDLSVVGFDDLPVAHLGRTAPDDGPPAARADGRGRGRGSPCGWPRANIPRRPGSSWPRSSSSGRAPPRRPDDGGRRQTVHRPASHPIARVV